MGWSDAPHEVDPGIMAEEFPAVPPPPVSPLPAPIPNPPGPMAHQLVQNVVKDVLSTLEYADLTNAEASFMGHRVDLDEDSCAAIKMILGQAIAETLRKEQERVLDSVQDTLPKNPRAGTPVLPALFGPPQAVDKGLPSPGPVLRVRKPRSTPGAADVPNVSRKKARTPRKRAARPRVPRQDDSGVPPA